MADTNSTNLLDGLNQLVLAINELTTATTNQVLNVSVSAPSVTVQNTVPVPSVTVEPAAVTVEPAAVSVNFDTSALSDAISNAGALVAGRLAPDGQSIHSITELVRLELVDISAKLAPNGKSIQAAVADLLCICSKLDKLSFGTTPATIAIPISTAPPVDAYKCAAARWLVGKFLTDMTFMHGWADNLVGTATDAFDELIDTTQIYSAVAPIIGPALFGALNVVVDFFVRMTLNDLAYMIAMVNNNNNAFLCDIYQANTPEAALQSVLDRLDVIFANENPVNVVTENVGALLIAWIFDTGAINRVFVTETDEYAVTDDEVTAYAGWTLDCSACQSVPGGTIMTGGPYHDSAFHPEELYNPNVGWTYNTEFANIKGLYIPAHTRYSFSFYNPAGPTVTIDAVTDGAIFDIYYIDYNSQDWEWLLLRGDIGNVDLPYTTPPNVSLEFRALTNITLTLTMNEP